jgi:type IV secretory pathway VirJ component
MKSLIKYPLLLFWNVLLLISIIPQGLLWAQNLKPTRNLPATESRSTGNRDYYVIFLTGNGGRQNLVQSITHYLNIKNVSVLALNTKKYLWSEKDPDQIGCDLEALIDRYNKKWGEKKVVIIGFSMGAEVLPFALNCMEDKYLNEITDLILIGPWQKATFKIRLKDYYLEVNNGSDIYPELLKMKTKKGYVICDDNEFSICRKDLDGVIDYDLLEGGHHFGRNYIALSKLIGKRLNLE